MYNLIVTASLLVFCGFTKGFYDTSQGHLTDNVLVQYSMIQHEFCLLEGRSELLERCEIPEDGHMVPVAENMVRFPRHSVCQLRGYHPTVDTCITCKGGSWETSSCATAPSREKRFFGFIAAAFVACVIFCRGGGGGGSKVADYKPPSFSTCDKPSADVYYADRGKTSTKVSWTQPVAKDGNGKAITPQLIQGNGISGSEFDKGRHFIVYKATDSKGFWDYCFITFEVKVRTCVRKWIPHGNRICNNSNYIFGTTCQVMCDDGYDVDGAAELTCEECGWNYQIPSCKPKQCPDLSSAFRCTDTTNYGSICFLSCDRSKGLSVTNPSITFCMKTGAWLVPIPRCVDESGPVFDNCPTASIVVYADRGTETATVDWDAITATDNSGNVTVTKTRGQASGSVFPRGSSIIKYKATDGTGNEEECVFNVVVQVLTCGPPPYTDNKMRFDCTNQYVYGSACSISCVGALLNGSNSITCEKDNAIPPQMHWRTSISQPPVCIQSKCDNLTVPRNGALTCDKNLLESFCVMSCNTSWDIPISAAPSNMYRCGWASGTWFPNSNVPDCTVKRIPGRMRLPSEFHYFTGDCNDPTTQEQIKQNYITILNSSASIAENGCILAGLCSIENVEVWCGPTTRRRRDAMEVHRYRRSESVVIVSWDFTVKYECGSMSTSECLTYYENTLNRLRTVTEDMLAKGDFNSTIPGVTVRSDSYRYDYVTLQCGEGMTPIISSGSCAVCPTGTMYRMEDRTTTMCIDCPKGTYQDEDHSPSCKDCPQGTTTLSTGARSSSECKDMCGAGNISATGIEPCTPCPVGGYQPAQGSTSCLTCPVGTTTQTTGGSSASDCQSYDLTIQGPSQLTSSLYTTSMIDSFTLFLWMKINSASPGLTIAFTSDQVKIQIGNALSVSLQGNQAVSNLSMEKNKWMAIAVVFDYSSKVLSVYKGGLVARTTSVASATTPVIATSSTVTISCSEGVNIRAISFIRGTQSSSAISALSRTCDVTSDGDTVMTLDDMTGGASEKVTVIIPSSCDAVDECLTSDPCNGHPCINKPASYACQCQDGYTGSDCSTPPDFCLSHKCDNEATCMSGPTNYTCTCPPGFKGPLCETRIVNGGYSNWTDWSTCPVTCGGGVETRARTCNNPPPDVDGSPCSGPAVDNRNCNTDPCPVCRASQLQPGINNSESGPDCDGNDSELQCRVVCKRGFYVTRDQNSDYNCSNGQWTPTTQLASCLEVVAPKQLTVKSTVNFTNPGCLPKQESEGLKTSLENKLQSLECENLSGCVTNVDVHDCTDNPVSTTADITFTVDLPEGDLELESFSDTNIMSPNLQTVVEAIRTLEITAQQLQNDSTAILEVTSGGVTFTPATDVSVKADVSCDPGYFVEDGFCGPCPAGTYYDTGSSQCDFCPRGSYQGKTGQMDCTLCPEGTSTEFIGSSAMSKCDVEVTQSPSSTKSSTPTLSGTTHTASTPAPSLTTSASTTTTGTTNTASTPAPSPTTSASTTTTGVTSNSTKTITDVDPGSEPSTKIVIIVGSILGAVLLIVVVAITYVCLKRSSASKAKPKPPVTEYANPYNHLTMFGKDEVRVPSGGASSIHQNGVYDPMKDVQPKSPYASSCNIYNEINEHENLDKPNPYYYRMADGSYQPSKEPEPDHDYVI